MIDINYSSGTTTPRPLPVTSIPPPPRPSHPLANPPVTSKPPPCPSHSPTYQLHTSTIPSPHPPTCHLHTSTTPSLSSTYLSPPCLHHSVPLIHPPDTSMPPPLQPFHLPTWHLHHLPPACHLQQQ
ncbi:hypothetical protein Pmani_009669 [Petrolisthes manimaculis]|uniref:Uncharacterized protein n=1 Tax=Petrolisthes manimaculis TaxID=1843537 RepID=A0AAE1UGI3_9EUCA|nr:hypothetical protein Pmani_009669 [Petrolisthes manimaculis]